MSEASDAASALKIRVDEFLTHREAIAGRPIVDQAAFDEAQALIDAWMPLARMHTLNGESRGVAVLDTMLLQRMEPVASAIGTDIERIVPEFRIGDRGRVDRAVVHKGGRLSLIEVKDGASPRAVVAGIGQALFYKAIMERTSSYAPIVPMLAVLDDHDTDIARACSMAGVEYLPLGGLAWTRALSLLAAATICAPRIAT